MPLLSEIERYVSLKESMQPGTNPSYRPAFPEGKKQHPAPVSFFRAPGRGFGLRILGRPGLENLGLGLCRQARGTDFRIAIFQPAAHLFDDQPLGLGAPADKAGADQASAVENHESRCGIDAIGLSQRPP